MTNPRPAPGVLVSQLADDPDLKDIVEMFVAELPDRVAAIQAQLAKQDVTVLASLAHQLKGAAGGYGFPSITDAARELELSAKTGDEIDKLKKQVDYLANLCSRARAG